MSSAHLLRFTATVIRGSGRGKNLGTPTINVALSDVPPQLKEGIYACRVVINEQLLDAVLHYGPRPVFRDTPSCEVHVLDTLVQHVPANIDIVIVGRLRAVRDFPDVDTLMEQIAQDITAARAMLCA